MKIVFVTSTLTSGGSERVISLLANEFSKRGYTVSIVCLNKRDVFYPLEEGVKVLFAIDEAKSNNLLKKLLWFRTYIKRNKTDVVIPFMIMVYCVTIFFLFGINIPIVSSERIDPRSSSLKKKVLRMIFLPFTDHLVVQTELMKSYYPHFIRKKTTVIYNPVTPAVYDLKIEKKENKIVSVGKLFPQKNHKMLIRAFSRISNEYPDYNLYIYGEGPLRKELQELICHYGIEDRAFLPGAENDVIRKIVSGKVFVFTSDYEGLSNALIEAICLGLPVISTRVSGVEDLIDNEVNGEVINVGDTNQLVTVLRKVLSDDELQKKYSDNNKRKAFLFKCDRIVDQWECIIKDYSKHDS